MSEAIMLREIKHWVYINRGNGNNEKNGCFWTYNSVKKYHERFPFMSERTIRAALSKLVHDGYIKKGWFNPSPRDRTTWYTLTEKGDKADVSPMWQNLPHASGKNSHMQAADSANSMRQNLPVASGKNVECTNYTNKNYTDRTQLEPTAAARAHDPKYDKCISLFVNHMRPAASQRDILRVQSLVDEYGNEEVKDALEESIDNDASSLNYTIAILERKAKQKEKGDHHGRSVSGRARKSAAEKRRDEQSEWDNQESGWG